MLIQIFGKFISIMKLFASWVSVTFSHLVLHIHVSMVCNIQTRFPKSVFHVSFLLFFDDDSLARWKEALVHLTALSNPVFNSNGSPAILDAKN